MERRKVLLIVAAVIAALGTLLVVVYVQGADARAASAYHAVKVLQVAQPIEVGETVAAAQASGKIKLADVSEGARVPGALSDLSTVTGKVAIAKLFPGEQLIADKFGSTASSTALTIPDGMIAISVNLSDPSRVAGFVNPGNKIAIFMQGTGLGNNGPFSRMLLPSVQVLGVGATTIVSTTTTTPAGSQTTEQLPRTLITIAVTPADAERVFFAVKNGDLAVALLNGATPVPADGGVTGPNLFH